MRAGGLGRGGIAVTWSVTVLSPICIHPLWLFTASLTSGSRQIQLAVSGAYEKPQLVPLQQTREPDPPPTFTFHVNPVLNPKLHVGLEEKLLVLQVSEQRQREEQQNESV